MKVWEYATGDMSSIFTKAIKETEGFAKWKSETESRGERAVLLGLSTPEDTWIHFASKDSDDMFTGIFGFEPNCLGPVTEEYSDRFKRRVHNIDDGMAS
jgi:hypothetical protein